MVEAIKKIIQVVIAAIAIIAFVIIVLAVGSWVASESYDGTIFVDQQTGQTK